MYINWDVSLYKLMVYSLQIKLSPPSVFEISLSNSYTLDAFMQVLPMSQKKAQGTHFRGAAEGM